MNANTEKIKKILFISCNDWVAWGGSEELWYKTALHLKGQGHEIYVCVKYWNPIPNHINILEKAGCIIIFRDKGNPPSLVQKIVQKILKIKRPVYHHLDIIKPDLVLINQGSIADGLEWGKQCKLKNLKYSFLVQLVNELNVWDDLFLLKLQETFTNSTKNYFVSEQNLELFESLIVNNLPNATIVRNPFKETNIIKYPATDGAFNIAFVGSLNTFHKGQDMLFEILKSEKWKSRNVVFNLYGKGVNEVRLKKLMTKYNLQNIVFKGFEPDIEKIYSLNHASILCSRMEGQSLALIEAMYCGRVCMITDVGGARELINQEKDGFIAKSPNIHEIELNLENAWNKRAEWEAMGLLAAAKIRNVLNGNPIEIFSQELLNLTND